MLLIAGSRGLLGSEFRERLSDKEAFFATFQDMDVTDRESIRNFVKDKNISAIINCTAACDVEGLEDSPDLGEAVNVRGVENLAIVSKEIGASLIYFSSDYVFDGTKTTPYVEEAVTSPLSVYGQTKLRGEREVLEKAGTALVIRTSWLFSSYGKNFLKIIAKLASGRPEIGVVFDQVGSPCYAGDLAEYVLQVIPKIKKGTREIYHLGNQGVGSWYDLAYFVVRGFGLPCKVKPIHSAEYPTKAQRPSYSVLDKSKALRDFGLDIRHYSEALTDCIAKIKKQGGL